MKLRFYNVIALVLGTLHFADRDAAMGGGAGKGTTSGGYQGAPHQRAESVFISIKDWTPGQFRNAVPKEEVTALRDPEGNTVLHRAILDGNLEVAQLIVKDYGFTGETVKNRDGKTCPDLAILQGAEFAGIFGDMPAKKV